MRYKLSYKKKIIEIKSENAALTHKFQLKSLVDFLMAYGPVNSSLDYGCGKLRYLRNLRKISQNVFVTDSIIQLERSQIIINKKTSIKEFVQKSWNDVNTIDIHELDESDMKFDFILCSNVLSAVPQKKEIDLILKRLKTHLRAEGECLIVNQHTNSYFTKWKKEGNRYGYGWIFKGYRGHSYYGIINKNILEKILPKAGFKKIHIWIDGQSTFALCS